MPTSKSNLLLIVLAVIIFHQEKKTLGCEDNSSLTTASSKPNFLSVFTPHVPQWGIITKISLSGYALLLLAWHLSPLPGQMVNA